VRDFHLKYGSLLPAFVIGIGIVERVRLWSVGNSLWLDEASLALNILGRSPFGLFRPLDYDQGAPLLFLQLLKVATFAFGSGERALRVIPLLFGIASCVVFYFAARELAGRTAAILASLLFSMSSALVSYSVDGKQYSGDVFATCAVLWLISRAARLKDLRSLVLWAVITPVLITISHPALFVIGSASLVLAWIYRPRWSRTVVACISWVTVFAGVYLVSLRGLKRNQALIDYWADAFVPHGIGAVPWAWHMLRDGFRMLSIGFIPLALVATGAGLIVLARQDRVKVAVITLPFAAALAASALKLYPLEGRLELFLLPCLLIPFAAALALLCRYRAGVVLAVALTLVFARYSILDAKRIMLHPTSVGLDFRGAFLAAEKDPLCQGPIAIGNLDQRTYLYYSSYRGMDRQHRAVFAPASTNCTVGNSMTPRPQASR